MANLVVLNCSRACAYALRARDTDTRQSHKRRHDWAKILNYEGELFAELILSIFIFLLIIFIIQPNSVCEDRLGKAEGVANPLPLFRPDQMLLMALQVNENYGENREKNEEQQTTHRTYIDFNIWLVDSCSDYLWFRPLKILFGRVTEDTSATSYD